MDLVRRWPQRLPLFDGRRSVTARKAVLHDALQSVLIQYVAVTDKNEIPVPITVPQQCCAQNLTGPARQGAGHLTHALPQRHFRCRGRAHWSHMQLGNGTRPSRA
ncbi:hypothetical protein D3C71_1087340 [compost metagenome]